MNPEWKHMARAAKKALITTVVGRDRFRLELCGHTFRVTYETRRRREDRDYPLLQRLAQGKSCIFDVGANMGLTSLVMSTTLKEAGRIYAFEASEDACRVAQENVALNGLSERIQMVNALITEQPGDVCDFYWAYTSGGASTIAGFLGHWFSIKKATLSLDAFCKHQAVFPELVKIDVEGGEARVVQGMTRVLHEAKPTVVVELHNWGNMTVVRNAEAILPLLHRVDYEMIYLRTCTEVIDPAVFESRGRCHVLLLPKGHSFPKQLEMLDTSRL